jgi:hypothetical protein
MRYDVHYCSPLTLMATRPDRFPGDEAPTLQDFDRCYRYVGTFEAENLNELVDRLQPDKSGLGDKTMQKYVIRLVQHTSIENGDIAIEHDIGRVWFLMMRGWKQIELI